MNRRGFLAGFASLLAAPAIVPFASLMPVRGVVMAAPSAGRLLTPEMIAREALSILNNSLVTARLIYRGYEDEFEGLTA